MCGSLWHRPDPFKTLNEGVDQVWALHGSALPLGGDLSSVFDPLLQVARYED